MPAELAVLDGTLLPLTEARIEVTDEGLLRGDGVFEVIRLYGSLPFALERHLARLERSAAGLRLSVDAAAIRGDVERLIAAADASDCLVRLFATRGGHRVVLLEQMPTLAATYALGAVTYAPVRLLDGIKSLSYGANMLAGRLAGERGFDDALLITPHGRVLECPTASFFIVRDGVPWTAPLSDHVLDSITRRLVVDCVEVREEPIAIEDLAQAEEFFLASSVHEVAGVHRVEQHERVAPGPVTAEIATRVSSCIQAELAAQRAG